MLQPKTLAMVALLGLLFNTVVSADERRYDDRGNSWSAPQIRLGVDVIWGTHGYMPPPPPPPVAWYPTYYPVYYPAYYPVDRYHAGYGRGHHKHRHGPHRGDDWGD